ncbi:importin subunit alpha-1b-like [Nicotiana sylvestris]|uniref:importin subunit alpha-1b-like n=1 Tax=Nicotiana sylvestris TaxID=4096 RepID=UPI00388CC49E
MPYCQQQLKDGSAWILVLIFSFRLAHIFDMVEYGLVVEVLVKLLDFPDESLCEKAFLVVGQIAAGDCDYLLDHGALTPLLNKSKEANNNFPMQRKGTRILSLIFKNKPDLPSEQFNPADLGCLVTLLDNHNKDADVVTDICNIMYGIVKHGNMEVCL